MKPMLKDVVNNRLREIGLGATEAATAVDLERTFLRDITTGKKKSIREASLEPVAAALHWSVPQLMAAMRGDPIPVDTGPEVTRHAGGLVPVRVQGTIDAGAFRAVDEFDDITDELINEPRDEDFPQARQIAFDVAGDSMNALKPRPILPGDRVVCIDFEDLGGRVPMRDGMVVVLEQTLAGGQMRERSVKQLELYDDRYEFHPRSANPKHKPIVVNRDFEADDGRTVAILAIVRRITNKVPL